MIPNLPTKCLCGQELKEIPYQAHHPVHSKIRTWVSSCRECGITWAIEDNQWVARSYFPLLDAILQRRVRIQKVKQHGHLSN